MGFYSYVLESTSELPTVLVLASGLSFACLIAFLGSLLISKLIAWLFPPESHEEADISPSPSGSNLATEGERPRGSRRRRIRRAIRRMYSNIMDDDGSRSSDENSTPSNNGQPVRRRRHSASGPLNFARAAKDFLRGRSFRRRTSESRGALPRPPQEFFEPSARPAVPHDMSPELFYLKHNLSMLELPEDWPLRQSDITIREVKDDQVICQPGDPDDSIIVVLEGSLSVYISLSAGKTVMVKRIDPGQGFCSLLSLLDLLMDIPSKFKTVSVKANDVGKIAIYSFHKFRQDFKERPYIWTRPIQIICTRLLQVTLTTLNQHLGLGEELLKRRLDDKFDDRHRHVSGQSVRGNKNRPQLRQRRMSSSDDQADLQNTAVKWFGEALQLAQVDAQRLLTGRLTVKHYEDGQVLVEQGAVENAQLIMVVHGALKVSQEADEEDNEADQTYMTFVQPKELVGGLQLLTNEPSFFNIATSGPTTVAMLDRQAFAELLDIRPKICLPVASWVHRRLSTFVRAVDFAIDWVLLDSGQAVYRQGDMAESLFVVLSGRLRSVDKNTAIEEFGRGDTLGMLEVLQRKPRQTTVLAVRYSQLARVPEGLLNFVKMQFPQVGFRLVRLLGQFFSDSKRPISMAPPHSSYTMDQSATEPLSQLKNLHTIAVMPASLDVPLTAFTCELYHALNTQTRVLRLSSKQIAQTLGDSVLEKQADFRLMHWLNAQEDTYPLVIYECDYTATNWTRRCLRQADCILFVGLGQVKPPKKQFIEDHLKMNQDGIRTRKELVLLWKEEFKQPTGTFNWLKGSWFSGHCHVRASSRMFKWGWNADEKEVIRYYEEHVFNKKLDFNSDFARLGRCLTGNAVGLVLGGGGARGAAHLGIIKAIREHGIPVDIVGGTSIGAMIGGCFADNPHLDVEERVKGWFSVMCVLWRKIMDLTYAYSAMFTGAGFNKTLQDLFGDRNIEDMWLPYYCISTDISTSEMRVHRQGPAWAYVRASMSLAGYLPPLCDPSDGHLLLDGGYVNNLPADVMRSMGAKCVFACDVGSTSETNLYNYGDSLSGFWVLMKKLNPFSEPISILNMEEIQTRLAFVSCVRQLEQVKKAPYCHYLRPNIDGYKTLEFNRFDEILQAGFDYSAHAMAELVANNDNVKSVMNPDILKSLTRKNRRRERAQSMRNSFTDLAAQISRIPNKKYTGSLTDVSVFDEDWMDDDYDSSEFDSYDDMSEAETDADLNATTRTQTPLI
ncbi:unnamed protein product [Bursaphelenchus okinawaensis]|uniref:Neuropathy target esterase sws n=1 Tax=Bursaphelenchus okinawaensis TaxID=465554 RepID=A0A811KR03_9BILA|nr:unnamed protein product [Bursaphelenchus okinawaensis]CAG9107499.1 unnamed protein product [Bursaphelenchus okinawaensis]